MKSHIVKLSAIGIAGLLAANSNPMDLMAMQRVLTDKNSVAEITVPQETAASVTETEPQESTSLVEASGNATLAGVNAVIAEDAVLNIKYDRLGIADVEESLNVRAKAGTDAKIVGKMAKNAACNVEKVTKDGWAKIKSGEVKGYVKAEYLVMDEAAEKLALDVGKKMATVETTTLNARFVPSTQSGKYTLVPNGEQLEVVREQISEKYVSDFIEKHFTGKKEKSLISDVDQDAMKEELDDWICVSIDDEKVFVAKEFVSVSYELERAVSTKTATSQKESGENSSSPRVSMVEYAKQFLGNRYVYGGTSLTGGIDCSGFTMRIYEHYGYSLPRTSVAQASYTTTISASDAKPGDLFFYGYGNRVSHVAMYIGGGQVIHASNERTGIKISNAFYRTPIKVGRLIQD